MDGSSGSSESQLLKIGLKFGQKIYFEDVGVGDAGKSEGGLSPLSGGGGGPQKKVRTDGCGGGGCGGVQSGQQPPRCQVEGCNLDLSDTKTYYSRHKVCGVHSKTSKVIVNGLEQRFCQQCSRFHQLPEFDQGKRSCRRRLAGHNERRRKPASATLLSTRFRTLPPIFENNGSSGRFVMDFSSGSRGRFQWPDIRPEKFHPLTWQGNVDNPPAYANPNVPPGGCFNGVQDSSCALSLLSNYSSGSWDQISLEYYANPGAPMVQPATGTMVQGQFAASAGGWGHDTGEAHLGQGQGQDRIPQAGYSGELGLCPQGGRRYSSSADHIDWSL